VLRLSAVGPLIERTSTRSAAPQGLVYMAEVVVFGVVAADVILRVPRIPAPGDQVNAEALGWRIGEVQPTWHAGSARLGTTSVSSARSAATLCETSSWPSSNSTGSISSTHSVPVPRPHEPSSCSTRRASAPSSRWTAGPGRPPSCRYAGQISGQLIASTLRATPDTRPARQPQRSPLFS
jgi:hypothetical protein